ncbi:putative nucleotidyltransferase substrate binding domain-containing protein [Nitrosophilus alvini]|uniref:putative nucleotidyltransferase substrate binding domain-containing protein n=1 Tax=Nitrosophilus alvini TaxID=2714855 RepID=UPI00190BD2DC|nr:putative nucleotidyltransferase substrate binding domain-containing protein [Nitrosophilus alvini]
MNDIIKFLSSIHPFDELNEQELDFIAQNIDIGYYKENSVILENDDIPEFLYIILKGNVKEVDRYDETVYIYHEKDFFDTKGLLEDKTKNRFVTIEETITYELSKTVFKKIISSNKNFKTFFYESVAQKLQRLKNIDKNRELSGFLTARINEVVLKSPLIIKSDTSIFDAISNMQSCRKEIAIIENIETYGVVTDRDLRKTVLKKLGFDEPVEKIATFPAITINSEDFLFNALLKMTKKGIKHLVVKDKGQIIGTLELAEILSFFSNQSYLITTRIESARTLEELKSASLNFINVIKTLSAKGIKIRHLSKLLHELHKKIYEKVYILSFPKSFREAATLLVLGSEGRAEQLIRTDQDNALIIKNGYFKNEILEYAKEFSLGLMALGYPKCPGNIMVSNPYWCKEEKNYKKMIDKWAMEPREEDFINISVFLDAYVISGDLKILEELKNYLFDKVSENFSFLSNFAKQVLAFDTPLGFFNNFMVDKSHNDEIDIKKGGIFPIVHGARALSLQYRIENTNTVERIKEINNLGIIDREFATELIEAYDSLLDFRLKAAFDKIDKTLEIDNFIDPKKLSKIERDILKDSFKIVDEFKKFLTYHFKLEMVS